MSSTEEKLQTTPRNNATSPRNDSDNDIYYDEDIECLEEDCQKQGHPCVPEQGDQQNQKDQGERAQQQPIQEKRSDNQTQKLQGGQGDQQNQTEEGQRAQQQTSQQKGNQQSGQQGRQKRQRNRKQRQQRLTPLNARSNQSGQQNQQGNKGDPQNQKDQGQRAQQQPNNQQQQQQTNQGSQQNQQGGRANQQSPKGKGLGFNEGTQGPFGRFRGESVSTYTEKMPCSVKELFEHIPLEAMMIENWVRKRLVLVGDKQPLDKALQRLNRHKITSLPIINEDTGNIKGILDSLDVVNYLCSVLDKEDLAPARWDFNLQTTGQLLDMSQKKSFVISNKATMYDGLLQLAKGVTPRLMVFDGDCTLHQQEKEEQAILGLFTQSDIVRFLASNPYWLALSPSSQKTLKDLGLLKNSSEQVISVDQSIPAYQAFKKISDTNSTGIVVNDAQGRIVANLSAANIRGISRRNFQLLRRPLFEFLQRDRRRGWWTMPICIRESDTLEKCILQFGATKVHQMYICDDNGKATNVVTLSDVLGQFVTQGINA